MPASQGRNRRWKGENRGKDRDGREESTVQGAMSRRTTLARATSLAAAASFGAFALWACGPYFPDWLLTDESRILEAPTTWLKDALQPTPSPFSRGGLPKLKAVVDQRGPYRQTADADLRDVETATSDRNLTARYAEVRDRLEEHGQAVSSWRQEAAWSSNPPPPPELPDVAVPAG